jgi:hypothetical protein
VPRCLGGTAPTPPKLPAQAEGVSQREHWPRGRENDQCEKRKFGGDVNRSLALGVALAEVAKRAQAHRSLRIRQLTVSSIAA